MFDKMIAFLKECEKFNNLKKFKKIKFLSKI